MLPGIRHGLPRDWPLWRRQLLVILRLEIGRNLLTFRGGWVFCLAFAPALLAGVHSIIALFRPEMCSLDQDTLVQAAIFQLFYLRLAFFFGCLGIFVRLFRGEMVEKTLQYYFLAPLRREVLVIGKFLAGSLSSALLFATGVAACFGLMYAHHGARTTNFLVHQHGLEHLAAYLGVTLLACVGYGAVFLALGLVFKNPILPAVTFLGWEAISGMAPAALQHLSVTFYLKPLFPVELPVTGISGLFTVVVEPTPTLPAVLGLLLFALLVVTLAALRIRRVEIE